MLYILFLIMLAVNFYCWIKKINSKVIIVFSLLFLIFLFVGNNFNTDYLAYSAIYNYKDFGSVEIGYQILILICKAFNLSFVGFKLVIALLCFPSLIYLNYKLTNQASGFIFLYSLIQFFIDSVQIRNTIASILITAAIILAIYKYKKFSMFTILVSSTFHITSLVFVPLVILIFQDFKIPKNFKKIILTLIALFPILVLTNAQVYLNRFVNYIFVEQSFLNINKTIYFENTGVHYGCLVFWLLAIFNLLLIEFFKKNLEDQKFDLISLNIKYQFLVKNLDKFELINIYSCVFVFLLIIDINFYRIFRNIFILNYICYSAFILIYFEIYKKSLKKITTCLLLVAMFFSVYKISFVFRGADQTSYLLEKNIILEDL